MENKDIKQTTLRIPTQLHQRFMGMVGAQKTNANEVLQGLITTWLEEHSAGPRGDRVTMDHAARLLVKAVCDQITQDHLWAKKALSGAGMGLPGAGVFDRRIGHFSNEKQEIGRRFAHWVVRRCLAAVDAGKRAVLVCDSGTTTFWFLKALGEAIGHCCSGRERERAGSITVVTNNIPGAESFVTYAAEHDLVLADGKARIADVVKCRLLAGTFLPEYVAVTGPDTERDLKGYAEQARSTARKSARGGAVLIGVTTGNWVLVGKEGRPSALSSLARGVGHARFKRCLLDVCDEVFVLAPLGKLLVEIEAKDLNDLLGYTASATDPHQQAYEAVETPSAKRNRVKLVATTREQRSVLRNHSAIVSRTLRDYSFLPKPDELIQAHAAVPIGELKHLLFTFDHFAAADDATQTEIELPHASTRTDATFKQLFSIRPESDISGRRN